MFSSNINKIVDNFFSNDDYYIKESVKMAFTGYNECKSKEVEERRKKELEYIMNRYELVEGTSPLLNPTREAPPPDPQPDPQKEVQPPSQPQTTKPDSYKSINGF